MELDEFLEIVRRYWETFREWENCRDVQWAANKEYRNQYGDWPEWELYKTWPVSVAKQKALEELKISSRSFFNACMEFYRASDDELDWME